MELSEELKQEAVSLGLCSEWTNEWGTPDKDELCDKYVRGIDFAIRNNFPSVEYMKANFEGIMQKHGIYVSQEICLLNPNMVIANGNCFGNIYYDRFSVGRMYVRHDSNLTVYVSGNAKIFISLYDSAKISVFCKDRAQAYIYLNGGEIEAKDGNVYIREKKSQS